MDGYVTIGTELDTSDFNSQINSMQKTLEKKTTLMAGTIEKTFKLLKTTIIGLGIGLLVKTIANEMDDAITRTDALNNYAKVMGNLGISTEDARKSVETLNSRLEGLPTSLDTATLSVQRFTSANGNIKASTEMFLALNNAIMAGGAPMQLQKTALEQMSQAYAKGKPDMMEWRTIMTAMPAQLKQVALSMGFVSSSDLGEALRSGAVSMNDFMVQITKLNKQGLNGFASFEEQAKNSINGISTAMTNLKMTITRGLSQIMDAIGQSNIAGFFNSISNAIKKVMPYIVAFIKLIMTLFGAIAKLFGKKINSNASDFSKSINGASSSVSDLDSGISDVNDGLGGAVNKAKELKKQLTGFDEMNVLQDSSSDSSGSGNVQISAGGMGDLDLSGFDIQLDATNNKINEIYNNVITTFGRIGEFLGTIFDQPIEILKQVWSGFVQILSDIWNEYGQTLVDNISSFVDTTVSLFQKIWDDVIDPIVTPFLEMLSWLWEKHLKKLIENLGEFIMKLINGALEIYNKFIAPIVSFLLDILAPAWSTYTSFLIGVLGTGLAFVSDIFSSIIKILGGVIDFIVGIFTLNWKKAWNGVVSIFKGIIDGLVGIIKYPINLIIDAINSFIAGLNKIQIPDWVPVVGGMGFHIDKIPKLAKGGIINMPGRGIPVGGAIAGERGQEGVLPLTDSQQMAILGEAIGKYITINANITNTMNGRIISRELQKVQNDSDFAYNR